MRYVLKNKTTGRLSDGIVTRGTSEPSAAYVAQAESQNATVETIEGGFPDIGLNICKIVDGRIVVDVELEAASNLREQIQAKSAQQAQKADLQAMLATATAEETEIIEAMIAEIEAASVEHL